MAKNRHPELVSAFLDELCEPAEPRRVLPCSNWIRKSVGATATIGLSVTLAACSSSESTGSIAAGGGEAGALGVWSGGAESSGGSEPGGSGGASAGGAGVGGDVLGSGGQATGGGQGIGGSGTGGSGTGGNVGSGGSGTGGNVGSGGSGTGGDVGSGGTGTGGDVSSGGTGTGGNLGSGGIGTGGDLGSGGTGTGGDLGSGGTGTGGDPGSGGSGATGGSSEDDPLTQEQCDALEARYAEVLVEAQQCNPAYSGPDCLETVYDGIACGCEVPVGRSPEALDELAFLQIEFSEGSCPTPAICFMGGACLPWTAADCTEAGTCGIIE